jgi:quinol monooxygenase YgiN
MAQPFILIGTYRIKEGKLDDFERFWRQFVDFVEEGEPRLIAFNAYADDGGNEVAIVQVHPDVDSMEFHMKLIREHVEQAFADFLEDTVGMQIYGVTSDSALQMMEQLGGHAPLTVKRRGIGGFTRSAAERATVTL